MINITSNPAQKLAFGVASTTIAFTTDSTPAIQKSATGSANGTNFTVDSITGLVKGDFLATEGAGVGGTGPWVVVVQDASGTTVSAQFPALRTAVSAAVANRFERFETRYRAKKLTLTNLTNGDVYTWDTTLLDNQCYKTSGATPTTPITNGFLNRSNCVAIHPNLLPINCSFTLKCDYDYYS